MRGVLGQEGPERDHGPADALGVGAGGPRPGHPGQVAAGAGGDRARLGQVRHVRSLDPQQSPHLVLEGGPGAVAAAGSSRNWPCACRADTTVARARASTCTESKACSRALVRWSDESSRRLRAKAPLASATTVASARPRLSTRRNLLATRTWATTRKASRTSHVTTISRAVDAERAFCLS